jgi:hypothetical protein
MPLPEARPGTNQVKFANGTKEQLYTCGATTNQQWTWG